MSYSEGFLILDTDERKKNDVIQTHAKLNMDFSGDKFAYFKIFKVCLITETKPVPLCATEALLCDAPLH